MNEMHFYLRKGFTIPLHCFYRPYINYIGTINNVSLTKHNEINYTGKLMSFISFNVNSFPDLFPNGNSYYEGKAVNSMYKK